MATPERALTSTKDQATRPGARGGGLGATLKLLGCLILLGLGGALGWQARTLVLQRPVPDDPAGALIKRREALLAAGWKQLDGGVYARPCQAPCRPPRIYGGGAAGAVEVECLERNCGTISAAFALLDASGAVIGERKVERQGRQGERLQLVAESDDPRVSRVELSSLRARAVENGG
jgi:hypothetical protein